MEPKESVDFQVNMHTQPLLKRLVQLLSEQGIEYCHWKSNWKLSDSLSGEGDLDILVGSRSIEKFQIIIAELGFRQAEASKTEITPGIVHFFAHDQCSAKIVHVHVYYRVITGGSVLKNYHLPLERMLLQGINVLAGCRVPLLEAELLLLVLRKIIEHGSIVELLLVRREWNDVRAELQWLLEQSEDPDHLIEKTSKLAKLYLPSIDSRLLKEAASKIQSNANLISLMKTSYMLRYQLRSYQIRSSLQACLLSYSRFVNKLIKRFVVKKRGKVLSTGGAVIAITGPDATGKSTIVQELNDWLAENFICSKQHVGIPPASYLTFLPNKVLPFLRAKFSGYRSSQIEERSNNQSRVVSPFQMLLYSIRSLMMAHDRLILLKRIWKKASVGEFIVCDRYPSPVVGAMDSAQIDLANPLVENSTILRYFAKLEKKLYEQMPPADIVVQLSVPIEIALERNIKRNKIGTEGEDYIRRRHQQALKQSYPRSQVIKIDTSGTLDETISRVKQAVWNSF